MNACCRIAERNIGDAPRRPRPLSGLNGVIMHYLRGSTTIESMNKLIVEDLPPIV